MTGRAFVTHQECIDSLTAERYVLGELSSVERDRFEEHYFECPECAEAIRCLSQLRDGARAEPSSEVESSELWESAGSRLRRLWSGWLRPQMAAAGALALALFTVITGYQNVQLRNQLRPQSVQSILLRPETRGEMVYVRSQPAGRFLMLEADLPGASGNLAWSLRTGDGRTVMEGVGPVPEPGLSFKLLVPAAQLHTGDYTLLVRSDAGKEWIFRFQTGAR